VIPTQQLTCVNALCLIARMLTIWNERDLKLKRHGFVVFVFALTLLVAACEKGITVPVGTNLYRPVIEDEKCVFLHVDFNSDYDSKNSYASTQSKLTGVLTKVIECPYKRNPDPVEFGLIKSKTEGHLWVKLSDLRGG
jgi:hypothetical protein